MTLLAEVLDKANYERVSKDSLMEAFDQSSLFPIKLRFNPDVFLSYCYLVGG